MTLALKAGMPSWTLLPLLLIAGLLMAAIGPPIERLLRTVYDRDESFQLLLTFALVLMFQDVFRFVWGANPRSLDNVHLVYGKLVAGDYQLESAMALSEGTETNSKRALSST